MQQPVSCSPSSGVVVGVWGQGPLSPGRFSEGVLYSLDPLEKLIHDLAPGLTFSLSLLWPQLDSLCFLYNWDDGLCPLAQGYLDLWDCSFIWKKNAKEGTQEGRAELGLWGNAQCLWLPRL